MAMWKHKSRRQVGLIGLVSIGVTRRAAGFNTSAGE